jgi:death on curing protein
VNTKPLQFLSIDDVLRIHEIALKDQGGDPSIRDAGLLDSAIAQPKQQFGGEYLHSDIPSMAAAHAFHICLNHPFVDGNKRAGTAAMIMFLSDNGWSFDATADEAEPVILSVAAGTLDKASLTRWVMSHCHPKPLLELREFFQAIDFQRFAERANSLSKYAPGNSWSEFEASATEACRDIPFLRAALKGMAASQAECVETFNQRVGAVHALLVLYRLAEDMGYEW